MAEEENKEFYFLKIVSIGFAIAGVGIAIAFILLGLTAKR